MSANAANWLGDLAWRLWESRRREAFGFAAHLAAARPVPTFDPLATQDGWRFHRGLLTLELSPEELNDLELAAWFASPLAAWVEEVAVELAGLDALERLSVSATMRPYLGVRYALGTAAYPSMRLANPQPEPVTPADARRLTRCANFALVRALTLCPAAVEGEVLAALATADVAGLRRLTIKAPVRDTNAAFLGATPLTGQSALDVSGCDLSTAGFKDIVRSRHLRQLVSLVAYRNLVGCDGLAALAASPLAGRLTVLELQNTAMCDIGVRELAESALLERLVGPGLNLSMNPIADAGARALAACPHLAPFTELILRDCHIGDAGARALAASPNVANLAYLDLWKNRIGNAGAAALAASPHLGNLRDLSLRDNRVSARGARPLHARFGERVKV